MIRVRFAPSPTGYLHLGNMRTALFNYLFARRHGGKFILRIEDTDRERSKPEYEEAQKEDLLWMGIRWDEGPDTGGDYGPYRQSERLDLYQQHIEKLIAGGKAYECYVTDQETEQMRMEAKLEHRPPHFDNRGRHFSKEEIEKRKAAGIKPTVRFKVEDPMVEMTDLVRGEVKFNLDDMVGDFVIRRADGMPTFHLAVCVDDALMKVTHVIRGEDHLSNTPKHILLTRAMGYEPPQYGHLSLVHGQGGEPLSKRLDSVSIRMFRRHGILPEALANYIALLGWAPGRDRELVGWEELQQIFDVDRISKSSSNYDEQKLDWVNGQHFRMIASQDFVKKAFCFLKENNQLAGLDEALVLKVLPVFQDNIERFEQLAERLAILKEDFAYENTALVAAPEAKEIFEQAIAVLPGVSGEGDALYENFLAALKPKVKAKGKGLFMPLRVALTGKEHGPELKRLFPVLGLERIKGRFERALR